MFFLALRHLISRKKQTLLTLVGILLGSMGYVVITGFFEGFQGFLLNQLVNNDAHIRISAREDFLQEHSLDVAFFPKLSHAFWISPPSGKKDNSRVEDPQGWYRLLKSSPFVVGFSPQMSTQVILTKASATVGARLIGSIPEEQIKITNIRENMIRGNFEDLSRGGNRAIFGDGLLKKIGARIDDSILVSNGINTPAPFKIVGSFHIGTKALDDSVAYAHLTDVQRLNRTPNQVNEIAIRLTDFEMAHQIADDWSQLTTEKVESWDVTNASILSVFKIQNATRYLMIGIVLLVAGFGIYNILNVVVTQKRHEIAILRSMGFEQSDVLTLFISQGVFLGIAGSLAGLVLGFFICKYLETIRFGGGPMGGAGFLKISFRFQIYLIGMALGVGASVLASFLPARTAGKLTPIEIIRSGAE